MEAPFAFTAQFWGDHAVVCRAIEDRPGPVVEQQFGEFCSWTQAQTFATKLNEGLGLGRVEARQIVTSSLLATACIVQQALNANHLSKSATVQRAARAAQLHLVLSELALALTFCRSASLVSGASVLRSLLRARKALLHSARFLRSFDGGYREREQIAVAADKLETALQTSFPSFLPSFLAEGSASEWA